jgi:hypothetical protein
MAGGRLSADNVRVAELGIMHQRNQLLVPRLVLGTGIAPQAYRDFPPLVGDMTMKFETLMLRGLFIACLAVCGLIFGAMVTTTPASVQLATHGGVGAILLAAPTSCALPPDGVVCPQLGG